MSGRAIRRASYAAIAALFLLRHDLWLWDDPRRVLGLPVGLTYHVAFCVACAACMALLVRFAWPESPSSDR